MRTPPPVYALTLPAPAVRAAHIARAEVVRAEVLAREPVVREVIVVVAHESRAAVSQLPAASETSDRGPAARAASAYAALAKLPCPTGVLVRARA